MRQGEGAMVSLLRDYFEQQPDVRLACLFGSHARGSAGPLSDVDVAVLLDAPEDRKAARADAICADLMQVLHRNDIDVVVADRAPPLLRHRIARDGLLILTRGPHTATRFIVEAVRDYVDTAPLRRLREQSLDRDLRQGTFGHPAAYQRVDADA